MRIAAIAAAALTSLTACTPLQAHSVSNGCEGVSEFADRFDRAQLQKDGDGLRQMVADDLVFIDGDGKRLGKREFIDGWTGATDSFDPVTLVDRLVNSLGRDACVVSAQTVLTGTSGGKRFSSAFRYSDTFKRVGDHWLATYIQVTRIPK